MGVSVNKATSEVVLDLDGQEFVLRATFKRLAEFQRMLNVPGIQTAIGLVRSLDMNALYCGMRALSDPDDERIDKIPLIKHITEIADAIAKALTVGFPDPGDDAGNGGGATS